MAHCVGHRRVGVLMVAFAYVPADVGVSGELGTVRPASAGEHPDRCGVHAPRKTSAKSLSRLRRGRTEASGVGDQVLWGRGDLTSSQLALLEPSLPVGKKSGRLPARSRRQLIDGIRRRTMAPECTGFPGGTAWT